MRILAALWIAWCTLQCAALHAAQLQATVKDRNGKPVADAVVLAVPADAKLLLHG